MAVWPSNTSWIWLPVLNALWPEVCAEWVESTAEPWRGRLQALVLQRAAVPTRSIAIVRFDAAQPRAIAVANVPVMNAPVELQIGWIGNVWTRPASRNRGFAHDVVEGALASLVERGVSAARLCTSRARDERCLYRDLGFTAVNASEYLMETPLGASISNIAPAGEWAWWLSFEDVAVLSNCLAAGYWSVGDHDSPAHIPSDPEEEACALLISDDPIRLVCWRAGEGVGELVSAWRASTGWSAASRSRDIAPAEVLSRAVELHQRMEERRPSTAVVTRFGAQNL